MKKIEFRVYYDHLPGIETIRWELFEFEPSLATAETVGLVSDYETGEKRLNP